MSGNVGYATLQIIPSMKGVAASVEGQLAGTSAAAGVAGAKTGKRFGGGFGGSIKTIAKTMGALFAAAEVGKFFKDSMKGAEENASIQRITARLIANTGSAAGVTRAQVEKLSMKLAQSAGISDEAAQSTANLILGYKQIRNVGPDKIFDRTTAAAIDMAAALGTDSTSAAKQLGKALADPATGMSRLSRAGIIFTASQQKQVKALEASGNLLGAQKIVLSAVEGKFKGAAAAAATPAQKLATMWGRLQVMVGMKLIPIVDKLVTFLTTKVVPAIMATVGWFDKHKTAAKLLGKAVLVLVGALAVNKFIKWGQAIKSSALVTKAAAAGQWLLNAAMSASPITLIVVGVLALVAAFVVAYNKSETFRAIVQAAFDAIKTAVAAVVDVFTKDVPAALSAAVSFVTGLPGRFAKAGAKLWSWILAPYKAEWRLVKLAWGAAWDFVRALPGKFATLGKKLWSWILAPYKLEWQGVKLAVGAAVTFITGMPGRFAKAGGKLWGWIKDGLSQAWTWTTGKVGDIVAWIGKIPGKISGLAGKMFNAGKTIMGKVFDGLGNAAKNAGSFAVDMGKKIVNAIIDGLNKIIPHKLTIGIDKGPFHIHQSIPLFPHLPHLAQGGMSTGPMAAVIGDNPGGHEVALPLNSTRTISALSAALAKAGGGSQGVTLAAGAVQITEASDPVRTATATVRRIVALGKA